eukprot:2059935-Pyramimonas_sp.AAC.2
MVSVSHQTGKTPLTGDPARDRLVKHDSPMTIAIVAHGLWLPVHAVEQQLALRIRCRLPCRFVQ